jgi:hypothetical protein
MAAKRLEWSSTFAKVGEFVLSLSIHQRYYLFSDYLTIQSSMKNNLIGSQIHSKLFKINYIYFKGSKKGRQEEYYFY